MNIYLDNSATTKIRKEALDKYVEVSINTYGNPSSLHAMGLQAEKELDIARQRLLSSLADKQSEVVFTASGSEANNLAIFGRAYAKERYKRGARIITTEGEHASVSSPLAKLAEALGVTPAYLTGWEQQSPHTLAAHFEGEEFSEDELREIEDFVRFVKSRRSN